jgi:threonine dehydrogenase-like Zn-dependent dehydrogenase
MERGRIDTAPWVTHHLRLDELPSRFDPDIAKGTGELKAIVGMA